MPISQNGDRVSQILHEATLEQRMSSPGAEHLLSNAEHEGSQCGYLGDLQCGSRLSPGRVVIASQTSWEMRSVGAEFGSSSPIAKWSGSSTRRYARKSSGLSLLTICLPRADGPKESVRLPKWDLSSTRSPLPSVWRRSFVVGAVLSSSAGSTYNTVASLAMVSSL